MATSEIPSSPTTRRTAPRRSTRTSVTALIGAAVVVAGGGAFALSGGGSAASLRASAVHVKIAAPPKKDFSAPPATIATTKVPQLQAFTDANASSKVVTTLSAKTDYNLPRTLLVVGSQPGWYKTLLPMRPNDSVG